MASRPDLREERAQMLMPLVQRGIAQLEPVAERSRFTLDHGEEDRRSRKGEFEIGLHRVRRTIWYPGARWVHVPPYRCPGTLISGVFSSVDRGVGKDRR